MTEEKIQAECYQWFHNTYPQLRRTLFAVPNGGKRPQEMSASGKIFSREANRLKATGTIPGPSDLIFVLPDRVVFIEMKTEEGRQTEEQIDFEKKVTALGHEYIIIRSVYDFKEFVRGHVTRAINRLRGSL